VAWGREAFHDRAGLRRIPSDAGSGLQQYDLPLPRAHRVLDSSREFLKQRAELVDQPQMRKNPWCSEPDAVGDLHYEVRAIVRQSDFDG
jgi:hypothetical protein